MTDENKYPEGKLDEFDQGELAILIGVKNGKVVVSFETPIAWFGMGPDMAAELGNALIQHAREIGLTKPLEIEL